MKELPEILHKAAKDVHSLIEQLQHFEVKYASLEAQLRIIQNDLWAAEQELIMMRKERAER